MSVSLSEWAASNRSRGTESGSLSDRAVSGLRLRCYMERSASRHLLGLLGLHLSSVWWSSPGLVESPGGVSYYSNWFRSWLLTQLGFEGNDSSTLACRGENSFLVRPARLCEYLVGAYGKNPVAGQGKSDTVCPLAIRMWRSLFERER